MAGEVESQESVTDSVGSGRLAEVNIEEIMQRVRSALYRKGTGAPVEDHGTDQVIRAEKGSSPFGSEFAPELYQSLHQANVIAINGLKVHYELAFQTPLIGPLWMAIRRRFHQEIQIYTDALLAQQSSLNSHLVRALNALVEGISNLQIAGRMRELEAQSRSIEELRREVADLRDRVLELERERTNALHTR